jgi:ribonuclease VapC
MIIDTSVLIAILRNESDAPLFTRLMESATELQMSIASYIEAGAVVDSAKNPRISRALDELINRAEIEILPLTVAQGMLARQAYRDFGRGSGHPAKLDFGDCLSYALAKDLDQPLLFKGSDFSETDIQSAIPPS